MAVRVIFPVLTKFVLSSVIVGATVSTAGVVLLLPPEPPPQATKNATEIVLIYEICFVILFECISINLAHFAFSRSTLSILKNVPAKTTQKACQL
jgi:hypothetical protein